MKTLPGDRFPKANGEPPRPLKAHPGRVYKPLPQFVDDDESLTDLERALLREVRASQESTQKLLVEVRDELKGIRAQAPGRSYLAVVAMLWTSMLLVQFASAAERGLDLDALARAVRLLLGGG